MLRTFALLLTPLVTVALVYWLGIAAIIGCVALVFGTLLFSTGDRNWHAEGLSDGDRSMGGPSTYMAGL